MQTMENFMYASHSNVVPILPFQRLAMKEHRKGIHELACELIVKANCDCEALFGATSDDIARPCVIVLSNTHPIDNGGNALYFNVLPDIADEELAGFVYDLCIRCLEQNWSARHTEWNQAHRHCHVNARRLISSPDLLALLAAAL
jgi:hypothetical protein